MARSPEKLGLKLLVALKEEQDQGKTLLTCRPVHEILDKLRITDPDQRNSAVDFLASSNAIKVANDARGKFALPSPAGMQMLADRKQENAWTMDRRLTVSLALLVAAVAVAIAVWRK